jgi:hypothetical protein
MAYSRPPVQAGQGLTRSAGPPEASSGVFDYALNSDIATTNTVGGVQVGDGLSITPAGVLSATNEGANNFVAVKLTAVDYTATAIDLYIGATANGITITLPAGILGRVYFVKNQINGSITVQGTGIDTIDGSASKTLNTNAGIMLVFDNIRWNIL